jgi:tellurium resistance protein TerD
VVNNLGKNEVFDFDKHSVGNRLAVGLGWTTKGNVGSDAFDLDASAVLLDAEGRIIQRSPKYVCYYNNKQTADLSLQSQGDNRSGSTGSNDDETINIDLERIDARVQRIVFWITIHEASIKKQSFEQIASSFVRLYDRQSKKELCRFDLKDSFILETAIESVELNKVGSSWEFKAIGKGHTKSLRDIINLYL